MLSRHNSLPSTGRHFRLIAAQDADPERPMHADTKVLDTARPFRSSAPLHSAQGDRVP
jgi:hypothetical protein